MLVLVFLACSLSVVSMSPLAEPEPEAEAEPIVSGGSVVGFYTPVYYPYQQGGDPGFTYRFGPPLPSQDPKEVAGDIFSNSFNLAFSQYISSGLLKTFKQREEHSHNVGDVDKSDQDEIVNREESDDDDIESDIRNIESIPVIEITKWT